MFLAILHNAVPSDASAADRDVLVQAEVVGQALDELGHRWTRVPCTLDLADARQRLRQLGPDMVFMLVESLGGSDWLMLAAMALLDSLGLPYTGVPTEAMLLTTHKLLAKDRLRRAGLPTPAWAVSGSAAQRWSADLDRGSIRAPYIIKAVREHASFGLDEESVFLDDNGLDPLDRLEQYARRLGRACFVEQFVAGREFNLSVLGGPQGPQVLPPAEIDFSAFPPGKPRVVGQRAKWAEESFEFRHTPRQFQFPAADRPLLERLRTIAGDCWHLFGLRGWARVDFRVDTAGEPWVLEINSDPCLSPDAGFAAALAQAGIDFPQAIERILQDV